MAMSLRTPLGRVRGHGSAKSGSEHFWQQRLTAVALVPLTLWFVWAVVRYTGAPLEEVRSFLQQPVNAAAMLLLVGAGLYHMSLGLQVVIEDYLHNEGTKIMCLMLSKFAAAAIAIICVIAILRIAI
jgi:succinate dehydrogenase / fumarate reductase membrane anchor subunit